MGCIITIKDKDTNKYWMGCDSISIDNNYNYRVIPYSKIINFKGVMLIGTSGLEQINQYLRLFVKNKHNAIPIEISYEEEYIITDFIPNFFKFIKDEIKIFENSYKFNIDTKIFDGTLLILLNNIPFIYNGISKDLKEYTTDVISIGIGSIGISSLYTVKKYDLDISIEEKMKLVFESAQEQTYAIKPPYYIYSPSPYSTSTYKGFDYNEKVIK